MALIGYQLHDTSVQAVSFTKPLPVTTVDTSAIAQAGGVQESVLWQRRTVELLEQISATMTALLLNMSSMSTALVGNGGTVLPGEVAEIIDDGPNFN